MNKSSLISILFLICTACTSKNEENKQTIYGIGPITELNQKSINDTIVKRGIEVFNAKCASCHTMEYKNSGPDLSNILARRQPEWIMNYLLNHQEMLEKDSITIKTNSKFENDCKIVLQNESEAYEILEYFRVYQIWLHEFNAK